MPDLTYGQEDLTQETGFFIVEYVHTQRLECFVIFMYSNGCSAAGVIAATIRNQLLTTGCKLHSFLPSHTVPAYKTKQASLYWQLLQHYVPDFSE